MADHFLTKTPVDLGQCIEFDDALALDAYHTLERTLTTRCGPETARLFAEPLISRGNDQAPPTISWYSDIEGAGRPLSALDASAQADVGAQLGRGLAPLRELLDDAEVGPLVAAALHLRGDAGIQVVNGAPLLLNWGVLPEGVGVGDTAARAAHYGATLGRFLPLDAAPPLTAEERAGASSAGSLASGGGLTGAALAGAATGAAAAGAVGAANASGVGDAAAGGGGGGDLGRSAPPGAIPPAQPEDRRRFPLAAWLPLVLLLLLAGGTLAWLLMPATRIFPAIPGQAIPDAASLQLAERTNRALENRLADLRNALDGSVCRPDGTLLMPGGRTIEGLLPPDPTDPNDGPGTVVTALPEPVLPPDPARAVVPGVAPDQAGLLALIEARTLLVWVSEPGRTSTGTGFFVGPDLVVTNYHVIENAAPDGIYVTNKALGRVFSAQLVKALGPLDATGADFALLRVPGAAQPSFDILQSSESLRLHSVIAAGYPGDLLQTDRQFAALRAGDAHAVPELTVTDGSVNTEQQLTASTNALVHSATISTGNSGGPLIDMCGRLVGVNTFVVQGPLRNLNVALASEDLLSFLSGEGTEAAIVTDACVPNVRRPSPPRTAEAPDPAIDP